MFLEVHEMGVLREFRCAVECRYWSCALLEASRFQEVYLSGHSG